MAGRKHTALFIIAAVMLCFAMLGSFFFVAASAEHDCTHDDACAVCHMIDVCIHYMRCDVLIFATAVLSAAVVTSVAAPLFGAAFSARTSTLISLKTELRN